MIVKKYILGYWDSIVSHENKILIYEVDLLKVESCSFQYSNKEKVNGFYAEYVEGIFSVFTNGRVIFICWGNEVVNLDDVKKISWKSSFFGREFKVYGNNGKVLMYFKYKTFFRSMLNPVEFMGNLLDDDWGLVADLPSFIDSSVKAGDLFIRMEEIKCRFNNR